MLVIFFDIKGIAHKQFVLAGRTLNSAYYCDVLRRLRENEGRLRPELLGTKELVVASRQHTVSQFPFHEEIFDQKQHGCRPQPIIIFSDSPLKVKLKGHHFGTNEVIGTESQAVLLHFHRTRLPGCI
jgi:hypothetical protein